MSESESELQKRYPVPWHSERSSYFDGRSCRLMVVASNDAPICDVFRRSLEEDVEIWEDKCHILAAAPQMLLLLKKTIPYLEGKVLSEVEELLDLLPDLLE